MPDIAVPLSPVCRVPVPRVSWPPARRVASRYPACRVPESGGSCCGSPQYALIARQLVGFCGGAESSAVPPGNSYGQELAVVTVTYSPGDTLETFLDSVVKATSRPLRVLLADNGSTDGAPER